MSRINAVLPNCDVRVCEGIITTLGKRGIPIVGLTSKPDCGAFHSDYLTQKIISPSSRDEQKFLDFLIEKVPKGVLFFSDDHTALLFARHREKLVQSGFLLNLPSTQSLNAGFDKWQCHLKASAVGIPCAFTRLIHNSEELADVAESMPYPFIIKPTTLAGGNYVRVCTPEEVKPAYQKMQALISQPENKVLHSQLMAQEWLEYEMEDIWCVEAYYTPEGKPVGFFPIKKTRTVMYREGTYGSRLYAGESVVNEEIASLTQTLLDSLEWKGLAHLDWVYCRNKGQYYLTEINPRLPGFSFFPSQAGFDMGYYYYADLAGQSYLPPKITPTLYFETLRYPGDISSALAAIIRKRYSLSELIRSYARIFTENKPVVIDFFSRNDLKMTAFNIIGIAKTLLKEVKKFLGI
jgi:predicted ATP-grasp superfamily ATP-dependent carboligase